MKRQAGETLVGAKQHATNTYVRAADPTPLTGARPGAAAAIVASCVAAGGGAYCAVEGVPESLRAPVGLERSQAETKPASDAGGQRHPDKPSPTPAPPVLPADPPHSPAAAGRHPGAQRPAPTARPAAAPTTAVPENEFEPSRRPLRQTRPLRRHPRAGRAGAGAGRSRRVLAMNRPSE